LHVDRCTKTARKNVSSQSPRADDWEMRMDQKLIQQWGRISELLDQALDLPKEAREMWLAELDPRDAELRPALIELLSNQEWLQESALITPSGLPVQPLSPDFLATDAEPAILASGQLIGAYRLQKEIGRGGMAHVWLAERADGTFARQVALKLPHTSYARRDLIVRFTRERNILASLEHPNIARLYDAGVSENGIPYLAMEYVEGKPISQYVQENNLDIPARLQLFLQVLDAVQFAHERLVIHRDLKPSNILVSNQGEVRLLDFGIAKLLGQDHATNETELTQAAGRALTLDYASPEQVRGESLTTASDVYSLGVILYELLTGTRPYQLKITTPAQLEQAIVDSDPTLPSTRVLQEASRQNRLDARRLAKALSGDLDTITMRALQKKTQSRYTTATELSAELKRYLKFEPIQAKPESPLYLLKKFVQRNRLAVAMVSLVTVSIVGAASLSIWKAMEAREERDRAERVKAVLLSVFGSTNPYANGNPEFSMRDLLSAGVERVERDLQHDPAASVEIFAMLSESARDIGHADLNLKTAIRAHDVAQSIYGGKHPMLARTQRLLAFAYTDLNRIREAAMLVDRAIENLRRHKDNPSNLVSKELSESLRLRAIISTSEGKDNDALTFAQEAVDVAANTLGENDATTISALGDLSNKLVIARRPKEALAAAERGRKAASAAFADSRHPLAQTMLQHYAFALGSNGQYRASRDILAEAVEQRKKTFNPRGKQMAGLLFRLARAQDQMGELATALANFDESRIIWEQFGVKDGYELAVRYRFMGQVALQARQFTEAKSFLAKATELYAHAYGVDHRQTIDVELTLATTHAYLGEVSEAEKILRHRLAGKGLNDILHMRALAASALLDRASGDARAAQTKLRKAHSFAATAEGNVAHALRHSLAHVLVDAARAELEAGVLDATRYGEIEQWLINAMAIYEEGGASPTPSLVDAWVTLGRAHFEQGRVDEALQWFEKATSFWERFNAACVFAGEAFHWHGVALLKKKDQTSAKKLLARGRKLLASSPWVSHKKLARFV
jgi:eukaryotic-like serine/threonine-protein kinase